MTTYKTAPLVNYDSSFQEVAQQLFDLASHRLSPEEAVPEKGSYSFRPGGRSHETIVKILIFQSTLGVQMQGELPWRNDGVYVLVRTNGEFGDQIWREDVFRLPSHYDRMSREETVSTAPNYDARFAYFPVMAGENLDAIADFIASILARASK